MEIYLSEMSHVFLNVFSFEMADKSHKLWSFGRLKQYNAAVRHREGIGEHSLIENEEFNYKYLRNSLIVFAK